MKKETARRFLAIFAVGMAYGSVYNPVYIRYLFYDAMLAALECSNTELAFLNSFGAIVGVFLGLPGGWLADKFSAKKIVFWSVFANLPLCILSVMFAKVYTVQLIVWFGFCLTGGFAFWPAALKAVRLSAPPEKQESTFGIFEGVHGFSSMIGNFIAIGIFSMFADQVAGWKGAMLSMGVFSAIGAFLMLFCYKEGSIVDAKEVEGEEAVKAAKRNVLKDTLVVAKNPGTWLVACVIIGAYGIYLAQTYFTSYFTGVLGAAVVFSAAMSNFRSYGMKVIGGPIGGAIAAKLKSASLFNAICLVMCIGLIVYVWSLSPDTPNVVGIATASTLILAFFCLMAKGTMWATQEQAHIPRELAGTAIALISYLGFNLTEFTVPLVCGWWLDKHADNLSRAYDNIFIMLICIAVLGAAAAIILVIRDKKMSRAAAKA